MKRYCITILLLLCPLLTWAQDYWNPEPSGRLVNDYSGILSAEEREALEQRLVAFDDSTSNQIVVLITPTLQGGEIMECATRIGTAWGVGQKEQKNGVVILIKSKTEEEPYGDVAIAPGYGLEGALPDAFCKRIIDDNMIEPLGDGKYYKALSDALDIIEPVCRGEYSYECYFEEDQRELLTGMWVMVLLIVLAFILAGYFNKKHPNDHNSKGNSDDSDQNRLLWLFFLLGGLRRGGDGHGGFGGGGSGGFGGFGGGSFGGGGAHGRF